MSLEEAVSTLCKELTCPICMELLTIPSSIGCGHNFCHDCLCDAFQAKTQCPLCKVPGFKRDIAKNLNLATIVNIAKQIQVAQATDRKGTPVKKAGGKGRGACSSLDAEIAVVQAQLAENSDSLQRVSARIADIRNRELDPSSQARYLILSSRLTFPQRSVSKPAPVNVVAQPTADRSQEQAPAASSQRSHVGKSSSASPAAARASRDKSPERSVAPPPPPSMSPPPTPVTPSKPKPSPKPSTKRSAPLRDPFAFTSSAEVDAPRHARPPSPSLPHFSDDDLPLPPPAKLAKRTSSVSSSQQFVSLTDSEPKTAAPASSRRARNQRVMILLSGFGQPNPKEREMTDAIASLGGRVATSWVSGITHVVLPKQERAARTLKYLLGVVSGVWMIARGWLDASVAAAQWVDEEPYEVASDSFAPGAPRYFRLKVSSGAPGLFHKERFYLWGDFRSPAPDKAELKRLIELAGGTVVNRAEHGVKVICDPLLTPTDRKKVQRVTDVPLSSDYILDSISFCRYDSVMRRLV